MITPPTPNKEGGAPRRSSRLLAQGLRSEDSPKKWDLSQNQNPPTALPSEWSGADFSGAIPVASALGAAPGATPPRQLQLTMGGLDGHSKPELSTLLGIGSFYFALTLAKITRQCKDRLWTRVEREPHRHRS